MDSTSYPEMLLVALAQCQRACQGVRRSRTSRQEHASRCVEQQRSVGFGEDGQSANGLVEQSAVPLWLSNAIEPCDCIRVAAFNRRMRENRTSGGVGGWPGRKSRPLDPIKRLRHAGKARQFGVRRLVAAFLPNHGGLPSATVLTEASS